MKRIAALLVSASLAALVLAPAAQADFGIEPGSFIANAHATVPLKGPGGVPGRETKSIDVEAIEAAPPLTQAGAHPDATASFVFDAAEGDARDVIVHTPAGFLGDPGAVPTCDVANFIEFASVIRSCPDGSQVGVATVLTSLNPNPLTFPLYALTPKAGVPASFGFVVVENATVPIILDARVRSDGNYGLDLESLNTSANPARFYSAAVTLWGVPADPVHDPERWHGFPSGGNWGTSTEAPAKAFLTNPTWCNSGPLDTSLTLRSWQEPATWIPTDPADPNYHAMSPAPTGCERLRFGGPGEEPSLGLQPAIRAAATPSGYEAKLDLPYTDSPDGLADPLLRDTTVTLPEGVVLNAASANGLGACTSAQIGYLGAGFPEPRPLHFSEEPARCPDSSKLGTVEITTPLLDHKLEGSVYLAKQGDNPFGSLLAIYIVVEDPQTGIDVKLAGGIATDPATGQVTATFTDNPQLPFTRLDLKFFGGPGASLVNPSTCGTHTTTTVLTPWSAPATPPVTSTDSFTIDSGPNGTACAASAAAQPNAPEFEAGTVTPIAGAYSPFVLHLGRADGTQQLSRLDVTLPPGLTGKLAGIPYCPEAAIALAKSREGVAGQGVVERANPSCPAASRVGTVDVAAGAGPSPLHVQGGAYLAGPYKGAPVSLVIVTPAVAGPFDLGTVVVRSALYVDPVTAQIRAVSDPIPSVLDVEGNGFPLDVRSIDLTMDRPDFTLNPTSCEEMSVDGFATSILGQLAPLHSRFQAGACRALRFSPRLRVRLKGGTRRTKHPKLIATVRTRPGEANIARASVKLPHAAFLDQAHIRTVCTRVQWAAEACPAGSIYGRASARTPLLDYPLRGSVYLRSSSHELPDLVADLRGPAGQPIRVELAGRTDSVKGSLRNTFEAVPDAPVSNFRLELFGGKRGLVVNSRDLCAHRSRATVKLRAHNGLSATSRPLVRTDCKRHRSARPKTAARR